MFEFFVTTYGTQLLGLILCAIFGTLGYVVKQIAKTYLDNETKLSIAANVVRFVEQVWTEIHGAEKLQKAIDLRYRQYPAFCETMRERWKVYNAAREELFRLEEEGKVFLFAPENTQGFSRVEDGEGRTVSDIEQIHPGDLLTVYVKNGRALAEVKETAAWNPQELAKGEKARKRLCR